MPKRFRYPRPPLIEAVAEFRFEPGTPWDQTVPGLFYERVRATFPQKQQIAVVGAGLVEDEEAGTHARVSHMERLQLRREDGAALVQIGPHHLSITRLAPYESWEEFLPLIREALDAYTTVAAPSGIQRIGLRYVNELQMPTEIVELEDYLTFYPRVGEELPRYHGTFICGVTFPFRGGRDLARLQIADRPNADSTSFLLDIDYFLNTAGGVEIRDTVEWLSVAHDHLEELFEGCLTDRMRESFGPAMEVF